MDKSCQVITGKQVGDSYWKIQHPSGLTILLYPKENCSTTYAIFGTRYGSIDNCFQRSDEPAPETVPRGSRTIWSTSFLKARMAMPLSVMPRPVPVPTLLLPLSPPAICFPARTSCTNPWKSCWTLYSPPTLQNRPCRKSRDHRPGDQNVRRRPLLEGDVQLSQGHVPQPPH